jgi:two-component system, OmpR family, response regulator
MGTGPRIADLTRVFGESDVQRRTGDRNGSAGDPSNGSDNGDGEPSSARKDAIHILLVDREEDTLDLLGSVLRVSGYRVSTAPGAAAARAQIDRELPDVVLLDLPVTPDPAELEIARSLHAGSGKGGVKVVLHTSLPEAAASRRFSGYDGFLRKPAALDQIVETVDAALHRGN